MKILVCGLPGSGKTWLSERLVKHLNNCAWYNADFVRKYAKDWDFEIEGRMRQANRMKTFADFEKNNGRYVICDFVAPTKASRDSFAADYLIWLDTIIEGRVVENKKEELVIPECPSRKEQKIGDYRNSKRIEKVIGHKLSSDTSEFITLYEDVPFRETFIGTPEVLISTAAIGLVAGSSAALVPVIQAIAKSGIKQITKKLTNKKK